MYTMTTTTTLMMMMINIHISSSVGLSSSWWWCDKLKQYKTTTLFLRALFYVLFCLSLLLLTTQNLLLTFTFHSPHIIPHVFFLPQKMYREEVRIDHHVCTLFSCHTFDLYMLFVIKCVIVHYAELMV